MKTSGIRTAKKMPPCPVCGRSDEVSVRHHCHLRQAVLGGIRGRLRVSLDEKASESVIMLHPRWAVDTRVLELLRFTGSKMCNRCNLIDACDLGSRPGPDFSLSASEMASVRKQAGHLENNGEDFVTALRRFRALAASDYFMRAPFCMPLGAFMAREWQDSA